jgi:hypothetical protein
VGEVTRTYRLHVPLNYNLNNEAPVPLVMDYHGWAGNAYWQEKSSFFTGIFFVFFVLKGTMSQDIFLSVFL